MSPPTPDPPTPETIVEALSRPETYGPFEAHVDVGQTHISRLHFVGDLVYKVKKPVRLPFLDFSTLDLREAVCRDEVRLNARLAPHTYLGVAPLLADARGALRMAAVDSPPAAGERVVEWAVVMRRLPAERMLDRLLARGELDDGVIHQLAGLLADFHGRVATGPGVDEHGAPDAVSRLLQGNLAELEPFLGSDDAVPGLLSRAVHGFLVRWVARELRRLGPLMRRRQREGRVREGHGDLHAGNICCTDDGLVIYDCLEFNRALRCGDVALDLAFLLMDLDRAGFAAFARHLVRDYVRASGDVELPTLLPLFKLHRALVRTKVLGLTLAQQPVVEGGQRAAQLEQGRALGLVAASYALGPWLGITCGLPGTGKTTVARRAARRLGASVLRSDVVRKRRAGIPPTARPGVEAQSRLYDPDEVDAVYDELAQGAARRLASGRPVIVDATFARRVWRERLQAVAAAAGVPVVLLHVVCDDGEVRRRLERRAEGAAGREASDADVSVYEQARGRFEPPEEWPGARRLDVDGAEPGDGFVGRLAERLVSALACVALVLLAGCARLPTDPARGRSYHLTGDGDSGLGQLVVAAASARPGLSGVGLLPDGLGAFRARIAMCDAARSSLDLQYYIWDSDMTGLMLAERIVRAADRGVRVRVLLDDINVRGRDGNIAALSGHPNIEVRSFNPFADRNGRWELLTDFRRVNHRMHNKLVVVDNQSALLGGRNIADPYFGLAEDNNFRDLDVFTVGPVVERISTVFDEFWNAPGSLPFSAFVDHPVDERAAREVIADIRRRIAEDTDYPYALDGEVAELLADLGRRIERLAWAPVAVLYDAPRGGRSEGSTGVADVLRAEMSRAQSRLLVEAAYFVPGGRGVSLARELEGRGVDIRVLTNSMGSNDVLAAHAGYATYRQELLEAGVELHELRPDAQEVRTWSVFSTQSRASLHTKSVVIDDTVFVGSFNLDPRSARHNTEVGLMVWDEGFADAVVAFMDDGVSAEESFALFLDEHGRVRWRSAEDDGEVIYRKDPHSGWWQRFVAGFLQILPVEDLL